MAVSQPKLVTDVVYNPEKKKDGYLINDVTHFYNVNLKYHSCQSAGDLLSLLTSSFSLKENVHEHESNSSDTFSIS